MVIPKNGVRQSDLAALTAQTGDEFAMFTTGGRRMLLRGSNEGFGGIIDVPWAKARSAEGWRFSAHTHPIPEGFSPSSVLRSSEGDQLILKEFGNTHSAIFNPLGERALFTQQGDSLLGWKP